MTKFLAGLACLAVAAFVGVGAMAQMPARGTPVPLWPKGAPMAQGRGDGDVPTLAAYLPASNPTRTGVIIAPGGGYGHLAMDKEGTDIAQWLNDHNVAGFVLKYRLGPKYHHPVELGDALRAIRTVRAQAAGFGIDPAHVGMAGFSAGGHLAASAGTLYDLGDSKSADVIERQSSRPDFLILCYPVITMDERLAHMGSRKNLLGEHPDQALVDRLSAEKQVTKDTPTAFIFATTEDKTVPVMNSVLFYSALVGAKVPAELHLFEHGAHGVGLARSFKDLKVWPELLATWMRGGGWMAPETTSPVPCKLPCILN